MKLTSNQKLMLDHIRAGTFETWSYRRRLSGRNAGLGVNNTLDSLCRKKLVRYDQEQKKWVVIQ